MLKVTKMCADRKANVRKVLGFISITTHLLNPLQNNI